MERSPTVIVSPRFWGAFGISLETAVPAHFFNLPQIPEINGDLKRCLASLFKKDPLPTMRAGFAPYHKGSGHPK